MAVQAQYPSHILLFNNNNNRSSEQERKEMECAQQPPGFFFSGVNGNPRKRGREFQMMPTPSIQSPAFMNLVQLQAQAPPPPPPPSLVSTGLKLAFEDGDRFVEQDLLSLVNNQKDEIEQYLVAQGEQLRRTLAERTRSHYSALLGAAEERLRAKDAELGRAVRKAADLQSQIGRVRAEMLTWQARAMAGQATAASLHAQIQQAHLMPKESGDSWAEDAESAHLDPDRVEDTGRGAACRVCRASAVSVVLLPCRHLCLCSDCDAAVSEADAVCCPVCHAVRTGSVQVLLS